MPSGPTWLRMLAAVAAGLLLYASFPPRHLWWFSPIAFGLLVAALLGRRARAGFGYGLLFGLAWMLPLLKWLDALLGPAFGPWPWLGLAGVCAVLIALGTAAMAVASGLPAAPIWMAGIFIADEAIRQRFPADGFPWGRLAFSQPTGAFLPLASIGGVPLLGFAIALTGAGLAVLGRRLLLRGERTPRSLAVPIAAAVVPLIAGLACWPTISTAPQAGTVTVAAVQGSAPDTGLQLLYSGDVLWRTHVAQARKLAADITAHRVPRPDLVVFPESVADVRSADSPAIKGLADLLGVPVAVGARLLPEHGHARNVVIGWDPAKGETGSYAKQRLVPYGEYVPLRAIASWFTPFVNSESDMTPGSTPGMIPLGRAKVGFAICYEVAYDAPLRGAVDRGADLLAVPANNAWYGRTDASYQQLGMARVRAVEHGRATVVAATTGVSAIIRPDGSLITKSRLYTSTDLIAQVPLRTALTVADKLGPWTEWTLTALGLIGLVLGIGSRTRTRRAAKIAREDTHG